MMVFRRMSGTLLVFGLSALFSLVSSGAIAAEYKIDPAHTFIEFQASHLGFSKLNGRFNTFSGSFQWDENNPEASSLNITIKTGSVDSNWAERDKHLRGEEFLNVDKHPEATFKSTGYTGTADEGTLKGVLTLRGVSKEVELDVKRIGQGQDPWGGYRAGFKAKTTINRMEFGSPRALPGADEVKIKLFVEGIRQ